MVAPSPLWFDAPELTGEYIKLVKLAPHHAEGILAAADDDEIFTYMRQARPYTVDQAHDFMANFLDPPGIQPWAQVDVASNTIAGMTTYYDIDPVFKSVTIGSTWLARRYWRTSLNTESKFLLLRHAFETLGCVRVVWHVDNLNVRSQAAVTRLGAIREGAFRKHKRRRDGTWRDTVVFSMLDTEWPEAKSFLLKSLERVPPPTAPQ